MFLAVNQSQNTWSLFQRYASSHQKSGLPIPVAKIPVYSMVVYIPVHVWKAVPKRVNGILVYISIPGSDKIWANHTAFTLCCAQLHGSSPLQQPLSCSFFFIIFHSFMHVCMHACMHASIHAFICSFVFLVPISCRHVEGHTIVTSNELIVDSGDVFHVKFNRKQCTFSAYVR
jgi:hypothetical protein